MSHLVAFLLGLSTGVMLILILGALLAASNADEHAQLQEQQELTRRYVSMLEQQVFFDRDDEDDL